MTESYSYDAIDQVTGVTASGGSVYTQGFSYDATGNLISVADS
jgi:YD repeat-containing protein